MSGMYNFQIAPSCCRGGFATHFCFWAIRKAEAEELRMLSKDNAAD